MHCRYQSITHLTTVIQGDMLYTILQVYAVVDEMFLAGEIRETSQSKVLTQLNYLNSLD